jgi:hypothetical protein
MIFVALRLVAGAGAALMLLIDWPLGVALSLAVGLDFVLWVSGVVTGASLIVSGGLSLFVGMLGFVVSSLVERKRPGNGWPFSGAIVFCFLRTTAYVEMWAMGGFRGIPWLLPVVELAVSSVAFATPASVAALIRHRRAGVGWRL